MKFRAICKPVVLSIKFTYRAVGFLVMDKSCPDTLVWSNTYQTCFVECIYPFYTDDQMLALRITSAILGFTSFSVCYFYCFTGLLRPKARESPNNISYTLIFILMMASFAVVWENFLGWRYVFCNSNIELGSSENWACAVDAVFSTFFLWMAHFWFFYFNLTIMLRLYMARFWNSRWLLAVFWIVSVGWAAFLYFLALGFGEINYLIGINCVGYFAQPDSWYNYYFFIGTFSVVTACSTICTIFCIVKLLLIRQKSSMPLYTMLRRQARLLTLWLHYVCICIFTSSTIGIASSNGAEFLEDPELVITEYVICVLKNGGPTGCHQFKNVAPLPFALVYVDNLLLFSFPISVFLMIGFRKQLILFWYEYLKEIIKTKRIPIPFVPYFDTSTISTSQNRNDETTDKNM